MKNILGYPDVDLSYVSNEITLRSVLGTYVSDHIVYSRTKEEILELDLKELATKFYEKYFYFRKTDKGLNQNKQKVIKDFIAFFVIRIPYSYYKYEHSLCDSTPAQLIRRIDLSKKCMLAINLPIKYKEYMI